MNMHTLITRFILLLLASGVTTLPLPLQAEESLLIEQPAENDLYTAHREVEVRSTVNGDLVVAGRRVTIAGAVAGDIVVAAQTIEIRSPVGDDLRAAGQDIRVIGPVSGHIVAAGETVTIEQGVGDWAWVAGNTVELRGNVGADLKVYANTIRINGEIGGDAELIGDQLELGPQAVVRGDLRWRSDNEAMISAEATIEGEVIKQPKPTHTEELDSGSWFALPLNLISGGIVIFLLFSRQMRRSADQIASYPGRTLALGFAVIIAMPVLGLVLLVTGVGAWLGFALIFFYLLIVLLGMLTGLIAVSDMALRRFQPRPVIWQSLLAIVLTVIIVSLLAALPWLGTFVTMAILLAGIGALCWNAWVGLR